MKSPAYMIVKQREAGFARSSQSGAHQKQFSMSQDEGKEFRSLIISCIIFNTPTCFQPLFRRVRPAAASAGATGSFLTAAARFVVAAGTFAVGALRVGTDFFAPGLETMVVPALVALPSLSRPLLVVIVESAVPGLLVCLLGAREDGFDDVGAVDFTGLEDFAAMDDVFSANEDLSGDRGGTRGLWDLGDSTVVVVAMAPLRDAGRVGFASAVGAVVIAVLTRFFGLGSSARASAFSLSSVPKYSLTNVSLAATTRISRQAGLPRPLQTLPRRTRRNAILTAVQDR
jgi:hypothetical protein